LSNYINKRRYSNALEQSKVPVINLELAQILSEPTPFNFSEFTKHEKLSINYIRNHRTNKLIYIYDTQTKEYIADSPFVTYAAANLSLKLNRKSRTVFRLLDTGKLYKKRYRITSTLDKLSN
jgi:hypothetical protein